MKKKPAKQKSEKVKNDFLPNALKGVAIGVANVIPGVSGGTIAFITGIFERLINAIKSFDIEALKLLFKWDLKKLLKKIDFWFLLAVGVGMVVAILSVARLFEYLFKNYPVYIWSYFFGLILASIYYVNKMVSKWDAGVVAAFVIGTGFAVSIAFLNPAVENANPLYIFICGILAICSMILPGISGSFILILLGNYELIVIKSINNMNLAILIPFALGCAVGLIAFAWFLSWLLKKFKNVTIGVLAGFVLGSLMVIWPWKNTIYKTNELGIPILKHGEMVVFKYERFIPKEFTPEVFWAIVIMALGVASIILLENLANKK